MLQKGEKEEKTKENDLPLRPASLSKRDPHIKFSTNGAPYRQSGFIPPQTKADFVAPVEAKLLVPAS